MLRLFTLVSLCFVCFSAFAQIPPPDPDFTGRYNDVVTLPNGKYVAVGFLVRSYLQEVTGGTVISSNIDGFSASNSIPKNVDMAVAVQVDGKVLLTGLGGTTRLNPDGSLDNSFVSNGPGGVDITVNCQGKIFIANATYITQLNSNGSISTAFGNGGSVNAGFVVNHILLEPDGKIIAVGTNEITRYNVDGSVDTGFKQSISPGISSFGKPALQSDGKLLIPGVISTSPFSNNISVLRLNPDGATDSTFGVNGTAISTGSGWAIGAVVQEDGKIVIGFGATSPSPVWVIYYYGLMRFTKDGRQDPAFMNQPMGVYISPIVIKPHAVAMGGNNIYVAAETIQYPNDKRQPVQEYPYLAIHTTDGESLILKPNLVAPPNVVISNDAGVCTASNVSLGAPNTSGVCVESVINNAPTVFQRGTTTVIWTVTDISGNSNTAKQLVTVKDMEKPTLQAPTEQMFCNGAGNYNIPRPLYSDNCEIGGIRYAITGATERNGTGDDASGSFNAGLSTITWTVADATGNETISTTVVNVSQPFTVNIPDVYALPVGTNANTVYVGYAPASSVTLKAIPSESSQYTYRWNTGETTSSIIVGPTTTNTYQVTVTNASGCAIQSFKTISVINVRCGNKGDKVMLCKVASGNGKTESICVSPNAVDAHLKAGSYLGTCDAQPNTTLRNSEAQQYNTVDNKGFSIIVSDNPTVSRFELIVNSSISQPVSLNIYSSDGKLVESKTVMPNQRVECGGGYHYGVYFVEVKQGNQKKTVKLIKVK